MTDNPSAFPVAAVGPMGDLFHVEGMTLRDWFAGQALPEAFAHARLNDAKAVDLLPEEWAAKIAYALADAMLKAREIV